LSGAAQPMAGLSAFLRNRRRAQQTDHHAEIGIPFFEYFVFEQSKLGLSNVQLDLRPSLRGQ
jgi:hypothetical protein